jgi:hypothetical protein
MELFICRVGSAVDFNVTVRDLDNRPIVEDGRPVSVRVAIFRLAPSEHIAVVQALAQALNDATIDSVQREGLGITFLDLNNQRDLKVLTLSPANPVSRITFNAADARVPPAETPAERSRQNPEDLANQTVGLLLEREGQKITAIVPYTIAVNQTLTIAVPKETIKCCPCRPRCRIFGRFRCAAFEAAPGGLPDAKSWGHALVNDGFDPKEVQLRPWANQAGTKVAQARLLDVEGDVALFQRADGSYVTTRTANLSRNDLAFLNRWQLLDVLAGD